VWILCGLGNPGPKYAQNRHNIGFMVIDEIAGRARAEAWKAKHGAELATADFAGQKVCLLKPQEYMNVSGRALQRAAAFFQVTPPEIVVVHDELDLPLGRLQVKVGGGHGGHNGLRSIVQELGTADFVRVRCGVGRPQGGKGPEVADFVLQDFAKAERTEAEIVVKEAADAVETILRKGAKAAQNQFNQKKSD
jgi:PTH1 family peptidyl-tRNA hydrolase